MSSVPICTVPRRQLLVREALVVDLEVVGIWTCGGFGGGIGVSSPLDSGQLSQRIRITMYNIGVSSSYALSPSADFQTSFTYSRLNFGGSYTPTTTTSGQALVFDTTGYTVTAGPTARLSASDSLGFSYTFSQFSQADFGNFSTHSGQGTWARTWSREISSSVNGGLTLVEPIPATQSSGLTTQGSNQGRVPATYIPYGRLECHVLPPPHLVSDRWGVIFKVLLLQVVWGSSEAVSCQC